MQASKINTLHHSMQIGGMQIEAVCVYVCGHQTVGYSAWR